MWMTSCTGSVRGRLWEIWEKSVSWVLPPEEGWLSKLAQALWRVHTWFGADGKVSIERWYLSPYVEKPFNWKVIKSFVPELRSCQVFFVCRDSYVIYMCVVDIMNVLCTGMNMSISHIHVWLCNNDTTIRIHIYVET